MLQKLTNQKFLFYAFIALTLISINSCNKYDFDKLATNSWDPNFAIPLVDSRFGVYSILSKGDSNDVVLGEGGLVSIVYKGKDLVIGSEVIYNIPALNVGLGYLASNMGISANTNYNENNT